MIDKFGGGLYACVSDSYDIYAAVDKWYSLREEIQSKGGTLVVRPDSGNPVFRGGYVSIIKFCNSI